VQFYNSALAIVAGCGVGALSFRLLPPLSPALRTRRLLTLTLRDLRRLATQGAQRAPQDWEERMYSRLEAMPDEAEPLQRAQLLAALSIGTEFIHLRHIAPRLGVGAELDSALAALVQGDSAAASARFVALDDRLALLWNSDPQSAAVLRARGRILSICDALARHGASFDAGEAG